MKYLTRPHRWFADTLRHNLFILFCCLAFTGGSARCALVSPAAQALARSGARVPVLVQLDVSAGLPAPGALADKEAIAAAQDKMAVALKKVSGWRLTARLKTIPWIAGEVDAAGLAALARVPGVVAIGTPPQVRATLAQSAPAIGAPQTRRDYAVSGAGIVVGVVDSGLDLTHPDLQDSLAGGIHYLDNGTSTSNVQDDNGHGTHLAGVITGDGTVAPAGIAPGSRLLMVKVFNANLTGTLTNVIRGLDWLVEQKPLFPTLRFINMSFSVNPLPLGVCPCDALGDEEPAYQALLDAINRARAAEIWCVAAAGNDGVDNINAPACFSGVISVGATYDSKYSRAPQVTAQNPAGTYQGLDPLFPACHDSSVTTDTLACYSSRVACLSFLAPGYLITSTGMGGITRNSFGTSVSAAHVTGGLALLQSVLPTYSNTQLTELLGSTAKKVTDSVAPHRQYNRIDLNAAARQARRLAARNWWMEY